MKKPIKLILWAALALALVVFLMRAFQDTPTLVDVATIESGPLLVSLDDDGHTRMRQRYTVSAPTDGRLIRPTLKAGASVDFDETLLFEFEPLAPRPLDARSRAQAESRVEAATASHRAAAARVAKAEAQLTYAQATLKRRETLEAGGFEAQQDFDLAKRDERFASEELNTARFQEQAAELEVQIARHALSSGEPADSIQRLPVLSPMTGQVTRVFEESARAVMAGTPIMEVGDTTSLELVADFLSQDAVKIRPGMQVLIEGWGGESVDGDETILEGTVRLVEPSAFTKVSALGVEEQRINVVVDPADLEKGWPQLQDGYRAELRIVTWNRRKVTIVPTGALFRDGEVWAVFVAIEGLAEKRTVDLGHRNGLQAEVLDGLSAGDRVVLYPSELVEDGATIEVRE
ncbi:MAG: HlyD family efflux transporter periplasmic adaptor subunit [Planctomycetota bacterium]|nr:HlyD family efflux transporter periplasmic adaptor subunit [Planctomycetota bacterium]